MVCKRINTSSAKGAKSLTLGNAQSESQKKIGALKGRDSNRLR